MDDLDQLIERAQARRAAVPPMPPDPGHDAPLEHHETTAERVRRQAEIAERHLDIALDHHRELQALIRHIAGVRIPEALDDIEMCRQEARRRVSALATFTEGDERSAARAREKALVELTIGDEA